MISATSENEQDTILNLTETELEGISGGWDHGCDHGDDYGHDYGYGYESFRGRDCYSFYGDGNCWW